MDTNQLAQIIQEMTKQGGSANTIAMTVFIVTAIGGLITSLGLYVKAKAAHINSETAKEVALQTSNDAKAAAEKTTEAVNRIEISVNSERTAMITKLTGLTTEVERLKADRELLLHKMEKMAEEIAHLKSHNQSTKGK